MAQGFCMHSVGRKLHLAGATLLAGALAVAGGPLLGQPPRTVALPGPADAAPQRQPADYHSPHFLLHTDLPAAEARALVRRLESMLGLISSYWGAPLAGIIECYVVRDLAAWPDGALDAAGREKIRQGAGITHVETVSRAGRLIAGKAVVYAVADQGTPQHEAVHAYCGQTFGRMGPLWYSEGMAEMGQHWVQSDAGVHCPDYIIRYLRTNRPKTVRQLLAEEGEPGGAAARTGDSWQNYAWRWALCHLLVNHPAYSQRFRGLGLSFLNGAPTSFADAFAGMLPEIEFEYRFFLDHVEQGYRVDLCRWDWRRKFRAPAAGAPVAARVMANRGWQASGALVAEGRSYDYAAEGVWQIGPEHRDLSADGQPDGSGRLEGVVLSDHTLSEPFWLSARGSFSPPADGDLYLRCRDHWGELADNSGFVAVQIRAAGSTARPAPADAP